MGLSRTQLVSVSPTSEMAVLLNSKAIGTWVSMGTLARAPLVGGAPRESARAGAVGRLGVRRNNLLWFAISADATAWNIPSASRSTKPADGSAIPASPPRATSSLSSTIPLQGDDSGSLAVVDLPGNKKLLSGAMVHHSRRGLVARWKRNLVHRQQVRHRPHSLRHLARRQRTHGAAPPRRADAASTLPKTAASC